MGRSPQARANGCCEQTPVDSGPVGLPRVRDSAGESPDSADGRARPPYLRPMQATLPSADLPRDDEIPELVSREEATLLLRCSIRQVDRLREAGEIATQPNGRRRLILSASIAAYLARERARLAPPRSEEAESKPFANPRFEALRAQAAERKAARRAAAERAAAERSKAEAA